MKKGNTVKNISVGKPGGRKKSWKTTEEVSQTCGGRSIRVMSQKLKKGIEEPKTHSEHRETGYITNQFIYKLKILNNYILYVPQFLSN